MMYLLLFIIAYIVLAVYAWSLYIRRWHDLGHSGWWSLLQLVPIVNLLALIYLIFAKGYEGANAYGAPNVGQPFWRSVFNPGSLNAAVTITPAAAPAAAPAAMPASPAPAAPVAPAASVAPVAPVAPSMPVTPPAAPAPTIPSAPLNPPQQ